MERLERCSLLTLPGLLQKDRVGTWLLIAGCLVLGAPAAASAALIVPDTTRDELNSDGDCSLREAVQAANTNEAVDGCDSGEAGEDSIQLRPSTYLLSGNDGDDANQEGDLDVTESLELEGGQSDPEVCECSGEIETRISAEGNDRIVDVVGSSPDLSFTANAVSFENGNAGSDDGGAVRASSPDSSLTVENSVVTASRADDGGGIFTRGDLTIRRDEAARAFGLSRLDDNQASGNGGAIVSYGRLEVEQTDIGLNAAEGNGGAIYSLGSVLIRNSGDLGGGDDIFDFGCDSLTGVSGNEAAGNGGAVAHVSPEPLEIEASCLADNVGGEGGVTSASGTGGAIYTHGPISITGSELRKNVVGVRERFADKARPWKHGLGGAVGIPFPTEASFEDTIFSGNVAGAGGAVFGGRSLYGDSEFSIELAIKDTEFSSNRSIQFGGALATEGTGSVTIDGGRFLENKAAPGNRSQPNDGGAIATLADLQIVGTTFARNSASSMAGAVDAQGDLTVQDSTFVGNRAGEVPAIWLDGGGDGGQSLTLANTTLSGNVARRKGSAGTILIDPEPQGASLSNVTIARNGTRALAASAPTTVSESIFSGNRAGRRIRNCAGVANITSGGYNIESADTCGFDPGAPLFDLTGTKPLLKDLAANGGPTKTMALRAASPAIDRIPGSECPPPATDQRGEPRPSGAGCDVGAFERGASP